MYSCALHPCPTLLNVFLTIPSPEPQLEPCQGTLVLTHPYPTPHPTHTCSLSSNNTCMGTSSVRTMVGVKELLLNVCATRTQIDLRFAPSSSSLLILLCLVKNACLCSTMQCRIRGKCFRLLNRLSLSLSPPLPFFFFFEEADFCASVEAP